VRRGFISWAHVKLPKKDNTFVGAVFLTESLYAYQYMSLYASRGEVSVMPLLNLWHISAFVILAWGYLELTSW